MDLTSTGPSAAYDFSMHFESGFEVGALVEAYGEHVQRVVDEDGLERASLAEVTVADIDPDQGNGISLTFNTRDLDHIKAIFSKYVANSFDTAKNSDYSQRRVRRNRAVKAIFAIGLLDQEICAQLSKKLNQT